VVPTFQAFTEEADEHTTIYRPKKASRYDDDRTIVTPAPFPSDPMESRDTLPIPAPPNKKD
jgi:hypothetical protein